jgi:hypothetical protein
MEGQLLTDFLTKLIDDTKNNKIKWDKSSIATFNNVKMTAPGYSSHFDGDSGPLIHIVKEPNTDTVMMAPQLSNESTLNTVDISQSTEQYSLLLRLYNIIYSQKTSFDYYVQHYLDHSKV